MRADDGRIVSNFISQALAGEPLTVYGSGNQTRSLCYVDDLVRGLILLMRRAEPMPHPINLGNPTEPTVRDFAEVVLRLTGSRSPISYRPLPSDDPRRRRPDILAATKLLGWSPEVPLERGLPPVIEWFARSGRTPAAAEPAAR